MARAASLVPASLALLLLGAPARAAEPWSDADPAEEWHRYALGDFGFRAGAEYRAQVTYINPISLNTENARSVEWLEHRLRIDAGADWRDTVRIVFSADLLDGVLWGDNGSFGGDPSSIAGTNANAKNPNVTRPCVTLLGGDALDPRSYGYGICKGNDITVRKAYAEAVLPVGLLRVGRQPVNIGSGVQANDGDGRPNRFGISRTGNLVDRILFATKPLEAFESASRRDASPNRGLILAFAYDRIVTDLPGVTSDAVQQCDVAVRFLLPHHRLGRDLLVSAYYAHRWDGQYSTKIDSIGLRAYSTFGKHTTAGFDVASNIGTTREIATAYKAITNDPVVDQPVKQVGARAVVRYDERFWTAYLEADYASGDDDPRARTPLSQFTFAEDSNVGLLLFKHVLAFQSARASAAGVEALRRLSAPSNPAEAVNTRGAFTNAFALFPQFDLKPGKGFLFRAGVLMAWAPTRVIDPIASLQRRDGRTIQDDLVNFAGGKPARYYGTELDGRISWRFMDHFLFDIEGAVLFPGAALQDQDGYAVRSGMVQGRTTFFF